MKSFFPAVEERQTEQVTAQTGIRPGVKDILNVGTMFVQEMIGTLSTTLGFCLDSRHLYLNIATVFQGFSLLKWYTWPHVLHLLPESYTALRCFLQELLFWWGPHLNSLRFLNRVTIYSVSAGSSVPLGGAEYRFLHPWSYCEHCETFQVRRSPRNYDKI